MLDLEEGGLEGIGHGEGRKVGDFRMGTGCMKAWRPLPGGA